MYSEEFIKHFWERVDKQLNGCWLWTGGKSAGYGVVAVNRISKGSHRVSLEIYLKRPIHDGLVVAHAPIICHNRLCVNPEHLRETTQLDNNLDKHIDGTVLKGKNVILTNRLFTADQVKTIRLDTRKQKTIAAEYNVHPSIISNIKTNKTYGWV